MSNANQSLESRMERRAEEIANQTTEWFGIPGWEDIWEVELRSLGYKTMRLIQQRNEKERDEPTREIYNMADQLAHATVGFRSVSEDGSKEPRPDETWTSICKRLPPERVPEPLTTRRALITLVTDKRIHFLITDWGEWSKTVKVEHEEEVVADFEVTG